MPEKIAQMLNQLPAGERHAALTRCCASQAWATAMSDAAPFNDDNQVLEVAKECWRQLLPDDWEEALAAHPRIGDVDSLRKKFAATKTWAAGEQAKVDEASDQTLAALAAANAEYEQEFGRLFIVCATGKTADEMLAILRSRMSNAADDELRIAAAEQLKITFLRLRKLAS